MIPRPVWEVAYERGLAAIEAGDWDETLKAFDEVSGLSEGAVHPFQPRMAVLDTLLSVEIASVGAPRAAELASRPVESTEARLFALLRCLPRQLQVAVLFTDAQSSRLAIESWVSLVAKDVVSAAYASRNLIDFLPPEILALIGRFAVEDTGSSDIAFTLAAVSRRWRTVFLEGTQLWSNVHLLAQTSEAAMTKLETCLERSPIRNLVLGYLSAKDDDKLIVALAGRLGCTKSFETQSPRLSLYKVLRLVETAGALERLIAYRPTPRIMSRSVDLRPDQPRPSIKHSELRCLSVYPSHIGRVSSIAWLLMLLPDLEDLTVAHADYTIYPSPTRPKIISLPRLQRLAISRADRPPPTQGPPPVFLFPALRELDLGDSTLESYARYLFPPSHPPNTHHLTHLFLGKSDLDETAFIGHLPHLASLTHLDVRGTGRPFQALLRALRAEVGRPDGLCPRLEQLDGYGDAVALCDEARATVELREGWSVPIVVRGWVEAGWVLRWVESTKINRSAAAEVEV